MRSSGFRRCEARADVETFHSTAVTRAAWAALLGTLLVLTAAGFDTASLYLPGIGLLLLSVGAALWVALAAHGLSVERKTGPHTVQEDDPYPLRLELRPGALPPPGGELHDPLLTDPVPLGGRAPGRLRIDVRFGRRGRRHFEPGLLVVHDPLRLAVREVAVAGGDQEVLVLPRVEPVLAVGGGGAGGAGVGPDAGGDRAGLRGRVDGSAAELDLDGLRPYRLGTPASRIHWPAVARSGEMLERRLTSDADSAPLVVLDSARPPSEGALDQAVRAAASLCLHLATKGGCALLLPGERRPVAIGSDLSAWPAMHARLALVEACSRPPVPARARRAGAVIWVSASGLSPRELQRSAGGGSWLVTPQPRQGARPEFTVAGCAGFRLGRGGRVAGPAAEVAAAG
jgi:uncharacterized protein (DUF58 family)